MKNIKIYWGETLSSLVEIDDPQAETATLTIDSNPKIIKVGNFINGIADVTIPADETEVTPGKYEYQIKVVYSNGVVDKFPDTTSCSECSLPTVTILEALDMPGAS